MSKKLKFLALILLGLLLNINQLWGADGDLVYTLTCSKNTSYSAYATYNDVTINSKKWNAPGNQSLGSYWRIGGAKGTNVARYITGKSTIDKPIKKITVNHNGRSNSNLTINSFSVTVATDASFTDVIETKTVSSPSVSSAGSFDLTPTSSPWASGCYYKFTIVYTHSNSSNYGLDLTSLVFYEGGSGCSNYSFLFVDPFFTGLRSILDQSRTHLGGISYHTYPIIYFVYYPVIFIYRFRLVLFTWSFSL